MTSEGPPGRFRRLVARLAAEFGIVVLGVTAALWADGWAAERQQREVERARLAALADNVSATSDDIRAQSEDAREAEEALRLLASPERRREASLEEIRAALLSGFLYVPTFRPQLAVYEDLKSSGELALLTDPELRRALAAMDAELQRLDALQADMATVQQLNLDGYLLSRLDLRSIMGEILEIPSTVPGTVDLSFLSTVEFTNLVVFKLDLVMQVRLAFADAEAILAEVQGAVAR